MSDNLIHFPTPKAPRLDPFGVDAEARQRGKRMMEIVTLPDGRRKPYGGLNYAELTAFVEAERQKFEAEKVAPIREWGEERRGHLLEDLAAAVGMPVAEWLEQEVEMPDGTVRRCGDLTHADMEWIVGHERADIERMDVEFDAMIADLERRAYARGDKEAIALLADPETIEARRLSASRV